MRESRKKYQAAKSNARQHECCIISRMTWNGTFGSLERDTFPEMATLGIPVFGANAPKFLVMGMRYRDGSLSQALMTNDEWDALPEERRMALTVDPSWEWKDD